MLMLLLIRVYAAAPRAFFAVTLPFFAILMLHDIFKDACCFDTLFQSFFSCACAAPDDFSRHAAAVTFCHMPPCPPLLLLDAIVAAFSRDAVADVFFFSELPRCYAACHAACAMPRYAC